MQHYLQGASLSFYVPIAMPKRCMIVFRKTKKTVVCIAQIAELGRLYLQIIRLFVNIAKFILSQMTNIVGVAVENSLSNWLPKATFFLWLKNEIIRLCILPRE